MKLTPIVNLNISRWSAWSPGLEDDQAWRRWAESGDPLPDTGNVVPDVSYMPAMLRRRLTPLARTAMHVAWQCLEDGQQLPMIFSSSYGESGRTFQLTDAVAKSELMSPASFSLSVHNAIAGQLSIARKITAEVNSLSPVAGGVVPGLLEAAGILQEGQHQHVLAVFYDQPLPELYRASIPGPTSILACAVVVSKASEKELNGNALTLRQSMDSGTPPQEQQEQLLNLIRLLSGSVDTACWQSSGSRWQLGVQGGAGE